MKCIKTVENVVQRVSDEAAIKAVSAGAAKYIAREEWKKTRGAVVSQVARVRDADEEPKKAKKPRRAKDSAAVVQDSNKKD